MGDGLQSIRGRHKLGVLRRRRGESLALLVLGRFLGILVGSLYSGWIFSFCRRILCGVFLVGIECILAWGLSSEEIVHVRFSP